MEDIFMKEMDCVEVIVEKECYTKEGVHKGMQGWICIEPSVPKYVLVCFPQYGEKDNIATIAVKEGDLKEVPVLDALVNEKIKEQFGD